MTKKNENDLSQFLQRGDVVLIADIAEVSETTAWKWLKESEYRDTIGLIKSTNLTNAYAHIIKKNNEQRQANINKLNSINHE